MIESCKTLKYRMYGYIVDKTVEDGKTWYELCDPDDPDHHMVNAFRSKREAMEWAKKHPF